MHTQWSWWFKQSDWFAISDYSTIFTSQRVDNVWARFFPIFLEKDLLKVDKILGLTFFQARKDFEGFKTAFSIYCCWVLWSMDCLQLAFIRLEEAVLWTQLFLTRKIWPNNEVCLWQTNLKANVYRNSTFQVNTRKNASWKRRLTSRISIYCCWVLWSMDCL